VAATFNYTFPASSLTLIEFQGSAQPVPPTALINPSSLRGPAPLAVTFDGSGSGAAAGADIISYQWDLDDGNKASGMIASHTYTKPGTYTVTLSVTDSAGLSGTASVTIKVTSRTSKRR